jgi:hypothetical protein
MGEVEEKESVLRRFLEVYVVPVAGSPLCQRSKIDETVETPNLMSLRIFFF